MSSNHSMCTLLLALGAVACGQAPDPVPVSSPSVSRAEVSSTPATTFATAQCNENGVDLLLQAPHDPPSADELTRQCADPVPRLTFWAENTAARGLMRLRAIESLGRIGGQRAVDALITRAHAKNDLPSTRRAALAALGRATDATDSIREDAGIDSLSDPDPHVRVAATDLLSTSKSARVATALDRAKSRETVGFVKLAIARASSAQ